MAHSPEPWKYEEWLDGPVHIVDANGSSVCGHISDFSGHKVCLLISCDDMKRIVLCVNALRGISNETVALLGDGKHWLQAIPIPESPRGAG